MSGWRVDRPSAGPCRRNRKVRAMRRQAAQARPGGDRTRRDEKAGTCRKYLVLGARGGRAGLRGLRIASVSIALAAVRQARQCAGSPAPDCGERATDRRKAGRLVSPACEALGLSEKRDRKSVVYGTRVSVRVDLGGRRCIKKQKARTTRE